MRVLTQVGGELAERIAREIPGATVVVVPGDAALSAELTGDVLLALPWPTPNLAAVLAGGVPWVHVLGTGVDRFPLALVADRVLTCSRGASATPIAEWVLAMMLAFEKRLPETWIHEPPARGWHASALGGLAGRTVGLVGFGAIGQAVATRALAFGMHVRACRRTQSPLAMPGVEPAATPADAARGAAHLVVAAPATAATRHVVGAELLATVTPGLHLVNVARGALVDTGALRVALDDGRVACASLDVVEPEPLPAGHWLYAHPRVRLSPHVSWNSPGALGELVDRFIENLRRRCDGRALAGVVDAAAGY